MSNRSLTDAEIGRQVRGHAIVSIGSCIKHINKLHYKVKSQSDDNKCYNVIKEYGHNIGGHQDGEWTCTCPDFIHRHIVCKHVYAVSFSKELRKKIVSQDVAVINTTAPTIDFSICERCKSDNSIIKYGIRYNQSGDIQRYRCKVCNYKFIINNGFERNRANPKAVTAALDLYFKGVSLRKVCDHLKQFYNVNMSHVAIIKWLRKFVKVVKPFVNSITPPHLSGIYHVDEMMVHVRREQMESGHYQWLWNLMDDTTRFWISSMVSQCREITDARAVFQDAKNKTTVPKAIIHDGLKSYDEAFQKEYFTLKNPRTKNIRSISVRNQGLNSKVERLNGTMREREKVMRGMQKKESAQKVIEAMRIYYNYCRQHQTLGRTPAEQAGIKLNLNEENKVEGLIRLASRQNS